MTTKNAKVAPIPRGYRSVTPHITTTDVRAAIAGYQAAFGAVEVSVETAPNRDVAVFAQIKIGNSVLTIGAGEAFGAGFVSLHHYVDDIDAVWTNALEAGFVEHKAVETTFWGDKMGLLTDPQGVRWSVAQRVERVSTDERFARAAAAYGFDEAAIIAQFSEAAFADTSLIQ